MMIDASLVIDAVVDSGPQGTAARDVLRTRPAAEPLIAPGHLAADIMDRLRTSTHRPNYPLDADAIEQVLQDVESLGIETEPIPWADVHRAWALAQESLRYADAIYVAAAERRGAILFTTNEQIVRSGASIFCEIVTVTPDEYHRTARHLRSGEEA